MKNVIKRAAAVIVSLALIFTVRICVPFDITANAAAYAVWPAEPKFKNITTYFDSARNYEDNSLHHNGIDIEADGGSNIYAACGGEVTSADWKDGYGYIVIIYNAELGIYTFYAHASQMLVTAGTKVKQGDVIAKVGSTGAATGNHIHFGICTKLLAGWPAATYYDPLTYFTYSDNNGGGNPPAATVPDCSCSDEYAGIYTTKDVNTYLNIRSGHSASSAVAGQIPAGAEFKVTKGNGEWAHVEYNGVKGYSSMAYMKRISEIQPGMKIESSTAPEGTLEAGKSFSLRGVITSNLPIAKVWGGVYFRGGDPTSQYAEAAPKAERYDLSSYFDHNIKFGVLYAGEYTYKITAEDTGGNKYELISSDFEIKGEIFNGVMGDLDGDGVLKIADAVLLQKYLLGQSDDFSKDKFLASDMNKDGRVDSFDLIALKKAVVNLADK